MSYRVWRLPIRTHWPIAFAGFSLAFLAGAAVPFRAMARRD
jgi:hypothetical protein